MRADPVGLADDVRRDVVVPAVVAALELHDERPAGRGPRRRGSRGRSPPSRCSRTAPARPTGRARGSSRRAGSRARSSPRPTTSISRGGLHRDLADAIVGVAEDDRAEAGVEVDVLAAVGIPDPAAPGAGEDARRVEEAEARRDAAGDDPLGARGQLRPNARSSNVIGGDRLPAGCTLSTIYERRPSTRQGVADRTSPIDTPRRGLVAWSTVDDAATPRSHRPGQWAPTQEGQR